MPWSTSQRLRRGVPRPGASSASTIASRSRTASASATIPNVDPGGYSAAARWAGAARSDVEVPHVLRVLLDEAPTRLDFVAHERLEDLVGQDGVVERHLHDRPRLGVHRGLPELLGVHLTETLVALDHDVAVALPVRVETLDDLVALLVGVRVVLLLAPRDPVQRR